MNAFVERLQAALAPHRAQLVSHPLYGQLQNINGLQQFANYHVFAVWDFMSLVKSLQQQLTCVHTPWMPVGSANTRFLINEIVVGEESDVDAAGNRISHFELYLQAMQQMGADSTAIEQLLVYVQNGTSVANAMQQLQLPQPIQQFVNFTFDIIYHAPVWVQAAVFTYGREDLIPDMFLALVKQLSQQHPAQLGIFTYYLERHIEVDGGHHSQLATEMVAELCGQDANKWEAATQAAIAALTHRALLWDGVYQALQSTWQSAEG